MITENDFKKIDTEVKAAIESALAIALKNSQSDYILFLAEGEYKAKYKNNKQGLSPYVIDNREDLYTDETRVKFLVQFLQTFYTFPAPDHRVDDSEIRLHMEFMIYSHIWESKPFLKKLFRLAEIASGKSYSWNVHVPPLGKHKFILSNIRDVLTTNCKDLSDVISKGFHTTLRNAFAHSEYSFDNANKRIWLDSYTGSFPGDIQDISHDDWSVRFSYTFLLNYHMINIVHAHRTGLTKRFGTDTFSIDHPSQKRQSTKRNIVYREKHDAFNFA